MKARVPIFLYIDNSNIERVKNEAEKHTLDRCELISFSRMLELIILESLRKDLKLSQGECDEFNGNKHIDKCVKHYTINIKVIEGLREEALNKLDNIKCRTQATMSYIVNCAIENYFSEAK